MSDFPIPYTEEERNEAIRALAEKMVKANVPQELIEKTGLDNWLTDYEMEIAQWYPESRERRGELQFEDIPEEEVEEGNSQEDKSK